MIDSLEALLESHLNSGNWAAVIRIALVRGGDRMLAESAYSIVPKECLDYVRHVFEYPYRAAPELVDFQTDDHSVAATLKMLSHWAKTFLCRPSTLHQYEGEVATIENGFSAAKSLIGIADEIHDAAFSGAMHRIVADGLGEQYRFGEAIEQYVVSLEKFGMASQSSQNAFMEELGNIHLSMGIAYLPQRNFGDSERCFVSTISTFTELVDEIPEEALCSIILAHQQMGTMYLQREMFDEAKYRFEKAFNLVNCGVLCIDDIETKALVGGVAASLGAFWRGDLHQSQFFLLMAEDYFASISGELSHKQCINFAAVKIAIANLAIGSGIPQRAIEKCTDAVRVIVEGGAKNTIQGMLGIANAVGARGTANLNIGEYHDGENDLVNGVEILSRLATANDFFIDNAARADVNLSIAYRMRRKWNLAQYHCRRAIYFFLQNDQPIETNLALAKAYWNFGQIQVELESPFSAVCFLQKAAKIYLNCLNDATEALVLDAVDCFYLLGKSLVGLNDRLSTVSVIEVALHWLRQGQQLLLQNLLRSPIDLPMRRKAREPIVRLLEYSYHALTIKFEKENLSEDLAEAFSFSEQSRMQSANELTFNQQVQQYPGMPDALAERYSACMFKLKQISEIYAEHGQFLDPYDDQRESVADNDPESDEFNSYRELKRSTLSEYQQCVEEIQALQPDFKPGAPFQPISVQEIQTGIGPNTVAVQLTVTERGTDAIIVTQNEIEFLRLPRCDQNWINSTAKTWLAEIQEFDVSIDHETWNSLVRKQLREISKFCIGPIVKRFSSEISDVVFAPHKTFHLYPLIASPINNGRFGELFNVTVVPSLSHYFQNADRHSNGPATGHGSANVVVVDPNASDLILQKPENECLKRMFSGTETFDFYREVPNDLFSASTDAEVWHYAGHCSFLQEEPFNSYLEFGNGKPGLTIRDVFFRLKLPKTKLAVLSACESGMLLPDYQDEHLSFPLAFLCAGAKCVVASLWEIGDLPTYLFISKFYEKIGSGHSVSTSLSNAQKWLRGENDECGDAIRSGPELRIACQNVLKKVESEEDRVILETAIEGFEESFPDSPPFRDEIYWSSFVAVGQGAIRIATESRSHGERV